MKEKSDGGFAAGGQCDLASMCSDALRAHLLCGLTWKGRGGGWSTWHLPLSLREQSKSAARPQNAGTWFERYWELNSPESGRKMPAQPPGALRAHGGVCGKNTPTE